ncbi:serine protease [Halobacillus sp. ACCC02827]|uniref:S1C family serine protease n=1 Tax=unclassified Halobacillus TaxID=2636472 RepID=UPI000782D81F|nr:MULTISPECIES: serine protease [unclassified Halobacillus]WJE16716.1 serine protease [Halobacillus sp. ACCC02827]
MKEHDKDEIDIIDEDLYEEIDEDELYELVQEEKRKAWEKARMEKESHQSKRPFPKWIFWLVAGVMVINIIAVLPNTFSIPALDFLVTSAKLSTDEDTAARKKAVVVVEAGESRGTGFAVSEKGLILTNHHVIEGEKRIAVAFTEEGLFEAEVVKRYPDIDLALLRIEGSGLPYLELAEEGAGRTNEKVSFIGNPLSFTNIANEGVLIGYTQLSNWEVPVWMMDAPVYRGNSGSPVLNQEGKVIGVVFATLDDPEEGRVGLAVPIEYYLEKGESP